MKRIAIVGLGLIGEQRLRAINELKLRGRPVVVSAFYDPLKKDLQKNLPKDLQTIATNALICQDLAEVITHRPDWTIIAVPHDKSPGIAKTLLSAGLNILIEKPLGRSFLEAKEIVSSCTKGAELLVAQNYRFFPGVAALLKDIKNGEFGQAIHFSLTLGHGGSPADKSSWKLDKERCGGGALIDPGIHLIDLCKLISDKLEFIGGQTWSGFWQTGIEEECKLLLRSKNIPMIDLTISVVRWRSTFRLEFFGTDGYGLVEGRGRSYGAQEYRKGKRWGWQSGVSQLESEEIVLTSSCDEVFVDELDSLLFGNDFELIRHVCTAEEALANMQILEQCRKALKLN